MRAHLVLLLLAFALAGAAAGCGGGEYRARQTAAPTGVAVARATQIRCTNGSYRPLRTRQRALAAVVRTRVRALREPGGATVARFGRLNVNGVPTVLGVLGARVDGRCRARWYRVQLPVRPNGVTGWVAAGAVDVVPVTTRIEVDVSDRRLVLLRRGRPVLAATVAVGTSATPTPTGSYYVNQRLVPTDPTGPFGPGAVGISAFSPVLTGWAQGGPVAIHGTDRPELVGRRVSNGCIRVRNEVLRRIFDQALAGTPVVIRA